MFSYVKVAKGVRKRKATAQPQRLTGADIEALDADLATTSRCLNPGCSGKRTFRRTRQGRQQRFCGNPCRAAYSRKRADLIDTWVRLRWTQGFTDLPFPATSIDRLLSRVKWLLEDFGSPALSDDLLPTPATTMADVVEVWLAEQAVPEGHPVLEQARAAATAFYEGRKQAPRPFPALPKVIPVAEYARSLRADTSEADERSSIGARPPEPRRLGIGYWRSDDQPDLPEPSDLVDHAWDADMRALVARYFATGTVRFRRPGEQRCRICEVVFTATEYTDGEFVWPDGLAHYVEQHSVRLPTAVERYVLLTLQDLLTGEPDVAWWGQEARPRL